jgi:hypothetical protein
MNSKPTNGVIHDIYDQLKARQEAVQALLSRANKTLLLLLVDKLEKLFK